MQEFRIFTALTLHFYFSKIENYLNYKSIMDNVTIAIFKLKHFELPPEVILRYTTLHVYIFTITDIPIYIYSCFHLNYFMLWKPTRWLTKSNIQTRFYYNIIRYDVLICSCLNNNNNDNNWTPVNSNKISPCFKNKVFRHVSLLKIKHNYICIPYLRTADVCQYTIVINFY